MAELRRKICVSYVELVVQLHGCVENPSEFTQELNSWLKIKLTPDFDADITVEIACTSMNC